ncbi:MAG: permease [Actinomycetes bacterium]
MVHVLATFGLDKIVQSLREAFFMFWETLWALILGFTLSGVVQAFSSKSRMQQSLGGHGFKAIIKASGFGMVSSSCSYAATAMSKSLFQKGADFLTAMVFMFASTNLVVELGLVLVVLMGWEFAAAEFVGGPIMIGLLVLVGGFVLRGPLVDAARERLARGMVGGRDQHELTGVSDDRQQELERQPWGAKVRSKSAWADAASYTMADLTMLRKELVIGYLVAGFLTVMVPVAVWNALFISGHGFWTTLENVLIAPLIAFLSFVCSIGNVPMAAALWHGGISFGGVISFIFADLIAFPLVIIYRKYYGSQLAWRLFVVFYATMAAAGLIVEVLFSILGIVPTDRSETIVTTGFRWNYTTWLNLIFLAIFAVLYWLYRNRSKFGGGEDYAIDPVCGMQVERAMAPATTVFADIDYWFCSDRCCDRFTANPASFVQHRIGDAVAMTRKEDHAMTMSDTIESVGGELGSAVDPVCGMTIEKSRAAATSEFNGQRYWFCATGCCDRFNADPASFAGEQAGADATD